MAKRPHTNDLFELFPDLPWTRTSAVGERARILQQVEETRVRAEVNIRRLKAATQRVREMLSARRRG